MKSIFKVSGKRVEVVVEDGEITTCKVFNTDGSMNWIEIKDGIIYEANVSKIIKSQNGKAGEKNAVYDKTKIWGIINSNEVPGIFGTYSKDGDGSMNWFEKDGIIATNENAEKVVNECIKASA